MEPGGRSNERVSLTRARALGAWLLRQRLVHFAIIAALLLAVAPKDDRELRLRPDDLATLVHAEELKKGGALTEDERNQVVDAFIDDELLYREGLRLGLDRDDPAVRARVVDKMRTFAAESAVTTANVAEAELKAFYASHRALWREPAKARIEHVFLSKERSTPSAATALAAELARDPDHALSSLSGTAALSQSFAATRDEFARMLGADVAKVAFEAPVGAFQGPVATAYGWYVLRVRERSEAREAPFEAVRPLVLAQYMQERKVLAVRALVERLRKERPLKSTSSGR